MTSDLQDLGDVLVVQPQVLLVTVVLVLVVQGQLDVSSLLQLNLSFATLYRGRIIGLHNYYYSIMYCICLRRRTGTILLCTVYVYGEGQGL